MEIETYKIEKLALNKEEIEALQVVENLLSHLEKEIGHEGNLLTEDDILGDAIISDAHWLIKTLSNVDNEEIEIDR